MTVRGGTQQLKGTPQEWGQENNPQTSLCSPFPSVPPGLPTCQVQVGARGRVLHTVVHTGEPPGQRAGWRDLEGSGRTKERDVAKDNFVGCLSLY